MSASENPVLEVRDLGVAFDTKAGSVPAVDGVSLELARGEMLGVVGESGSGKSVTALSLLRMVPPPGRIVRGEIRFQGRDLLSLSEPEMRKVRGAAIGMVFQDPLAALNPVLNVGRQITEALLAHGKSAEEARKRAVELLRLVGIGDAERRLGEYPHQFSGGMRQRIVIAIALSNEPAVLLADEPTTALDVTIQAEILQLLSRLTKELGIAVILITHNMGIVAELCERVLVMYAGRVVESASVGDALTHPKHPYTWGLLRSIPKLEQSERRRLPSIGGQPPDPAAVPSGCPFHPRCEFRVERCTTDRPRLERTGDREGQRAACWVTQEGAELPLDRSSRGGGGASSPVAGFSEPTVTREAGAGALLELVDLATHFTSVSGLPLRRRVSVVRAVDGVGLSLTAGETLGLVGESGCGKSTLARTVLRIVSATAGEIYLDGVRITEAGGAELRRLRRRIQMIFQDPYASLNPRMTVRDILGEPLEVHGLATGQAKIDRVRELMDIVGLSRRFDTRYPREFSGGQRQRIGIARALALNPSLIVCDEPVSSLDVSIQAQTINLLVELQRQLDLSYLFISHDLAVVRQLSDRIAVMYLGRIVETGSADAVYGRPQHPYTLALLSAVPKAEPGVERRERIVLSGDLPSPKDPPKGCRFHPRCPIGPMRHPERTICHEQEPALSVTSGGQMAACHFAGEFESAVAREVKSTRSARGG